MPHKDPILDKQWHRDYYLKNKERLNKLNKQAHKENLIERKAQQKEYREKTKETKADYMKTYWNAKKEISRPENLKRYHKNKAKYLPVMKKYQKAWEKRNRVKRSEDQLNNYLKFALLFNLKSSVYKRSLQSWSQLVRNRDHNSCLQCGKPSNISHHIIYKKTKPELSFNLNNGIALCSPCHKEIHRLNR